MGCFVESVYVTLQQRYAVCRFGFNAGNRAGGIRVWLQSSKTVLISIVIPAFNEEKLLPTTLAAIAKARTAFEPLGWSSEVIVCDNNSSDQTAAVARNAGATVVFEPVNQIGRARNTGAAGARGDWLVFIDADSQPSVELLAEMAARIARGRVIAGGAAIELDESGGWVRLATALWSCWSRLARHMAGSFIFVDAQAFRDLGGFSEHLFAGEELDLSQRLKNLAAGKHRTVEIIARPRLLTSARKVKLYTPREFFWFFFRAVFRPRRMLSDREACHMWYDGRR